MTAFSTMTVQAMAKGVRKVWACMKVIEIESINIMPGFKKESFLSATSNAAVATRVSGGVTGVLSAGIQVVANGYSGANTGAVAVGMAGSDAVSECIK
eukprot:4913821-Ditylum_brightwellii.AAC.1